MQTLVHEMLNPNNISKIEQKNIEMITTWCLAYKAKKMMNNMHGQMFITYYKVKKNKHNVELCFEQKRNSRYSK